MASATLQDASSPPTRIPITPSATNTRISAAATRSSTTPACCCSSCRRDACRSAKQLGLRVTFHDPCHLGRFNKGYDAPREILKLLGCELVEMGRCRANSFCCGAGGGRIWIPDPVGAEKPAQNRMREAAAHRRAAGVRGQLSQGSDHVRGCAQDQRPRGQVRRAELIELVREALAQPQATPVAPVAA